MGALGPVLALIGLCCIAHHLAGVSAQIHQSVSDAPTRGVRGGALPTPHRSLQAAANPCIGIVCPAGATCRNQGGAPTCLCPPTRPHLVASPRGIMGCRAGDLPHAEYLNPQNYARASLGVPPLVWNDSLSVSALAWARTLTTCALHHPPGVPYGQNLASVWGTTTALPAFGINLWIQEAADYTFSVFPDGCVPGKMCGHYTQLVWNSTRQVGCAQAPCTRDGSAGIVWACDYFPPGNFLGQYPYSRNPCVGVACPARSTCVGTSGTAQCLCPRGQALVNNACAADPCTGHVCPGNRVCTATTGVPQCGCVTGLVSAPGNANLCISPSCAGVTCPAPSTCRAVNNVPVCSCPRGMSMAGNACAPGPAAALAATTSVALYPLPNFRGTPVVLRVSNACADIPVALAGRVRSVSVVWNTGDGTRTASSCGTVYFWNQGGCFGQGWGPQFTPGQILTQYPDTLNATATTYAPRAAAGVAVNCR